MNGSVPFWLRAAGWFNQRSLKQRVIVFAIGFAAIVGSLYTLKYVPLLAKQGSLRTEINSKQSEVASLAVQLAELSRVNPDPDKDLKARRDELKRLIAEAEVGLKKKRERTVGPDRVAQLLEDVLSRQEKVELVELKSLPAEPLFNDESSDPNKAADPKADKSKKDAPPPAPTDAIQGIYRHGVQITLRGEYMELLRYLNAVERLPVQLFWKDMDIQIAEYPDAVMKITLFTVSFKRAWMSV